MRAEVVIRDGVSPLDPKLDEVFAAHDAFCSADTPPESCHMIDRFALEKLATVFLVAEHAGELIGMGAIKRLSDAHGEVKSMHVLERKRGLGAARLLVDALVRAAADAGFSKLSLETGAQPSFAPARGLYASAGFQLCPPFAAYTHDPLSAFMTLDI